MKRKLSLLMALMMVIALIPMSSFAATRTFVNTVSTNPDGEFTSNVVFDVLTPVTAGVFEITLGENADFDFTGVAPYSAGNFTVTNTIGRRAFVTTTGAAAGTQLTLTLPIELDGASAGEQRMVIDDYNNLGLGSQTITYAIVSGEAGVITRRLESVKTVGRNAQVGAQFEIRNIESRLFNVRLRSQTVASSQEGIILELPKDVNWDETNTQIFVNGQPLAATAFETLNADNTSLFVTINMSKDDRMVIKPAFNVTRDARLGEIDVLVRGTSTESVVVAEYKEYGIVAKVDKVAEIVAGKTETTNDYKVKVTLDGVSGSFVNGRDIEFKLTNGKVDIANLAAINSAAEFEVDGYVSYDDKFYVTPQVNNLKKLEVEFYLQGGWNKGGQDLELTVEGAGVEKQTIKLAEILSHATIETEVTDVVLGLQRQELSAITLTESEAGSLDGRYYIHFPNFRTDGITLSDVDVDFEVTEGDLEIDDVFVENGRLVIDVERVSRRTASTLVITGLKVTLDRTVPYGPVNATFAFNDESGTDDVIRELQKDIPFINVVTEIQDARRQTVVFTLDAVTYTVGGEVMTLDAAPYISNNRTMLPIGTVAQLVGATVNYSPASRTAVFTKDNLVVSMNLDTNILLVNGSPVAMDAKPEIQNSRAFVPVIFVAQAFGIQNNTDIVYDGATRTVTMFPNAQ